MESQIINFPAERELIVDAGYLGSGRHIIYGLVEVDVTGPRQEIQRRKQAGEDLSFTAFMAASLGRALAEHPKVQAMRDWRGRLVIFGEADVVVMVEAAAGRAAIPYIIREAQRKSTAKISAEIRRVQGRAGKSEHLASRLQRVAPHLPRFLRLWFFHAVKWNPARFKQLEGTAIITSLGMYGEAPAWGVTFLPVHTIGLTIGTIVEKPAAHQGQVALREILHLTLAFDHDVVDGAPAARFAQRLVEILENGEAL